MKIKSVTFFIKKRDRHYNKVRFEAALSTQP